MSSKTVHTYLRSALLTLLLACVGIPSYAQAIYSLPVLLDAVAVLAAQFVETL